MSKIVFKDFRETKKVSLPSFPGSEVVLYTSMLTGDMLEVSAKFPGISNANTSDAVSGGYELLIKCIKEWNFTDEEGNDLPVSVDILRKIPMDDYIFLANQININKKVDKKKISKNK